MKFNELNQKMLLSIYYNIASKFTKTPHPLTKRFNSSEDFTATTVATFIISQELIIRLSKYVLLKINHFSTLVTTFMKNSYTNRRPLD